jgi:hypothetical protein
MTKRQLNTYTKSGWVRPKKVTVLKARIRVLAEIKRKGYITNERAQEVGRWAQAWYHLNQMVEDGYLRKDEYNRWILRKPGKRWYREAKASLTRQLEG